MKKSVIIIISVIYIVSIVLVGFLGQKMQVYDEKIYVNDIQVVAEGVPNRKPDDDYQYYFKIDYSPGVQISIRSYVKPDNATQKEVYYYGYEDSVNDGLIRFEQPEKNVAVVTFLANTIIVIYVRSTDGKNVEKCIQINAWLTE